MIEKIKSDFNINEFIKIYLISGKEITGKILEINNDYLTIDRNNKPVTITGKLLAGCEKIDGTTMEQELLDPILDNNLGKESIVAQKKSDNNTGSIITSSIPDDKNKVTNKPINTKQISDIIDGVDDLYSKIDHSEDKDIYKVPGFQLIPIDKYSSTEKTVVLPIKKREDTPKYYRIEAQSHFIS